MKKVTFSFIFSLLAILAIVSAALAEGAAIPGSGWWSGEQIQNVGSDTANIDITAYDYASNLTYTKTDTIDPGASKSYLPDAFAGMPDGFQGSAIVSSSQDIRAIVTVTNRYVASLGLGDNATPSFAAGMYQGMNVPATKISFPLAKNNQFSKSTTLFIQNAGSALATDARASFIFDNGVTYNYDLPDIGPGQMAVVTPDLARDGSNNPPPSGCNTCKGSVTVTSTQPLAGAALEHKTSELHATLLQATRFFTADDYDTTIYAPTNKNNRTAAGTTRFSGLVVQNVSAGNININVTYVGTSGCTGTWTDSATDVLPNASVPFKATAMPANCTASATIVGTGDIVGVVNESFTAAWLAANPSRQQESTQYSCLPGKKATTVISIPVFKEDANSKSTGFTVKNITGSDTTVILTFKNVVGTFVSNPQPVLANGALILLDVRLKPASFWNGTAMTPALLGCESSVKGCGSNGNFGLVIESTGGNIVAIANESTYPYDAPRIFQDKSNYEGFNLVSAP